MGESLEIIPRPRNNTGFTALGEQTLRIRDNSGLGHIIGVTSGLGHIIRDTSGLGHIIGDTSGLGHIIGTSKSQMYF